MCDRNRKHDDFNGLPSIPGDWYQGKNSKTLTLAKGERLGAFLNRAVNNATAERAVMVGRMATSAGISESTVNQILAGSIDCPPRARLAAFARVLPVSLSSILAAGRRDGCEYE